MKVEQIQRAMSVGVIGGLGAIGSADLYAKMTRTAAKAANKDKDRVKVLFGQQAFDDADMAGAENAQTNTRKLYVFDMLREFEQRGTSAVLLPCFISHTFIDEVQAEVGVPIIDMLAAIRRHLAQRLPKLQKIGVLTSSYVRKKALFEKYFAGDCELLYPSAVMQHACLMRAVYGTTGIKNGYLDGESIDLLYRACKDLLDQGAQVIVPGMTEIATVAEALGARGIPIIDTNQIYAESALNFQPGQVGRSFKIGVVGGVGPAATVDFIEKVIRNTPAARDQDHIKLVVEHNPKIPDRTDNLIGDGADPTVAIYAACKRLENDNADMIAIPCNTAHAFVERIQSYLSIPIVNMLSETVSYIGKRHGDKTCIGLLATSGTIASRVYQHAVDQYAGQGKFRMITPDAAHQDLVMDVIYGAQGVKAGFINDEVRAKLLRAIAHLVANGADVIVLGCTELPLLIAQDDKFDVGGRCVPVLDPTEILALKCVALAGPTSRKAA
ncbi:aspartate racemase [Herbaspirillum hiltneri N3]|uniref:Aspartate racemase n=1 Tax=Herbaspirillum hiltneri N3 TaxID=1262470 RepID=A0ABN4HRZ5_9BURK|nr:amino acid racemase [Herbaspirillum hiltneri]AKZ61279.1 aspartate racemase [Herbaspirillum hiltneri N3]